MAVFNVAREVGASIDCSLMQPSGFIHSKGNITTKTHLQHSPVPAIEEVAVETVACRVTHRPIKFWLLPVHVLVRVVLSYEVDFVEKVDQTDRMRFWAAATVDVARV